MSVNLQGYLFSANKSTSYADILSSVQEYMSNTYQDLLSSDIKNEDRKLIKEYIRQYIMTRNIKSDENSNLDELIEKLYSDMSEFSFLTDLIKKADKTGLEEIDINSWEDIEIIEKGHKRKIEDKFLSPQHAVDVIRRMLQASDTVIDNGNPTALGSLAKNIRITVLKTPILDEDVGICASIRFISAKALTFEKLKEGTASEEMLNFLTTCIRFGTSICISGNTGSGKTSTAGWLLSTIPNSKRVYTIEEGSREFDLIKRDSSGVIINSVIHTLTRASNEKQLNISQEILLDFSLRFNPDVICVGEMRSSEAFAAQEAARTGHTVITTIHAKSAVGTYMRMITLAKRAYEFTDDTLMKLMVEAFPIIVYQRQLEDSSRKITEIIEGEGFVNGSIVYRTLFRYIVDDNIAENDKINIHGHFEHVNSISDRLRQELLQNGASKQLISNF